MTESSNTLNSAEVDFLLEGAGADDSPQGGNEPAGEEQSVTMRGDLEQINLSDIFQTLSMTKMEGVLRVRNPLEQRQVYFNNGYVRIMVPPRIATRRLGQRLVQAGLIQADQLRAALVRQRKERLPIGELLVTAGLLTAEQVDEIAGMQVGEDLFALFTWRHGTFEFWKGEIGDPELQQQFDTCPEFEVSSLLLEVARRSDEWESILGEISSLDEVPHRAAEVPETRKVDDAARALVCGADGRATYRDLAEQTTLGLFEVARVARDLVREGILANIDDSSLVAVADAEATAGHHKHALMLLQTLRDRQGERELDIIRAMVSVLVKSGERRLAGTLLLEVAQLQSSPEQALALARQARDLAPNDAGTASFLRTTLIAHSAPDSAELEQCTIELLDALIEADRIDTAMEIIEDARATGTLQPQILVREARARQRQRDPQGAAKVLFELAEIYRTQNDRQRTIETYEAILRIDRSRKDVQKLLTQIRQTRAGRIIRLVAAGICITLLGAMGLVFWQQNRFEHGVQQGGLEVGGLLRTGDRIGAREALERWAEVLGESEAVEDLRRQIDFADAAEHTRLTKIARKRTNERLTLAAEALGTGDLRGALAIYGDLQRQPGLGNEVTEVVATRFDAVLTELEQSAKTMSNRLPPAPTSVFDRKDLTANLADLQSMCRPPLLRIINDLEQLQAASALPAYLPARTHERIAAVLGQTRTVFAQAGLLMNAYTEALQRNSTERRLDPMFKQAVKLEEAFDFAGALELYRQLEREPAGAPELRGHFRDQVARNATICRLMAALTKATEAGDFAAAQQQFRALKLGFPEVPFERLARLPLRVDSLPPGATVVCNGSPVGTTPCLLAFLPTDQNQFEISLPGFRPEHAAVTGDQVGAVHTSLQLEPTFIRRHDSQIEAPSVSSNRGQLLLVDRGGNVMAIDRAAGQTIWTYASGDLSGLLTPPVLYGDQVIVGSIDGDLRSLAAADGSLVWTLPGLPTEIAPVRVDHYLVMATTNSKLVVVDLEQRQLIAQCAFAATPRGRLQVQGSTIVVCGEDGRLAAHALPNLTPLWQRQLAGYGDPAATVSGGTMLVGDDHGHLTALDLVTGETRWQRNCDSETFGNPIVDGDSIFFVSPQRILRFALADGREGPAIAMGTEPWSGPPARVGKRLLVPAQDGTIHVIDLATATAIYSLEGHKRRVHILSMGTQAAVALPDRRFLFFAQLR